MIKWIKSFFKKEDRKRHRPKSFGEIIQYYIDCERELRAMHLYTLEQSLCTGEYSKRPKKNIIRRYNLDIANMNGFAWYLLEQYFAGNIIINNVKENEL